MNRRTSWCPFARAAIVGGLFALALSSGVPRADAYTFQRVALDSNILVSDGRVIFAQGTGSLTVLDLETGEVLLRKKREEHFRYSGTIVRCKYGVLMFDYSRIALLDGGVFNGLWQADPCQDAAADGEYIVSHDGNQTITCRRVQTGQVCWSAEMKGGWHIVAAKGKALVATGEYWQGLPALTVFDLQSGQRLLRHEAQPDERWMHVYFDGESVYIVDAKPDADQNRPQPGRLTALNLHGKVAAQLACQSREIIPESTEVWDGCFYWQGKFFSNRGWVRPVYPHEPASHVKLPRRGDGRYHSLPGGVLAQSWSKDADGEAGLLLTMFRPERSWDVFASHLRSDDPADPLADLWHHSDVDHVTEAQGRLLLGTSQGHVECLDMATGRARWIYRFPVVRQTMSYTSPNGMPPYLTELSAEYRQEVASMDLCSAGSLPLPQGFRSASARWSDVRASTEYAGRVVIDPSPDDPYPNLGWNRLWLSLLAAFPIVAAPLVFLGKRAPPIADAPVVRQSLWTAKPGPALSALYFFTLSLLPALGLLELNHVSQPLTRALKIVLALTFLGSACFTIRLYCARRWIVATALAILLFALAFRLWFVWWYA